MAKGIVIIDRDRCKGCGLCVAVCPARNLRLAQDQFNLKGYHPIEVVDTDACTGCAVCAIICPDAVFTIYRSKREPKAAPACAA